MVTAHSGLFFIFGTDIAMRVRLNLLFSFGIWVVFSASNRPFCDATAGRRQGNVGAAFDRGANVAAVA